MALKDRFVEVLNAVLPQDWQVNFREAAGAAIDPDEANWRPLTGDAMRDLNLITQEHMLRVAHWLWEQNPLANWLVEIKVAFLFAEGVQLVVQGNDDVSKKNQAALDRFWKDPTNEMALKLPQKARELSMFGEQVWPVFVREEDGRVKLGYIDPKIIGVVVTDPDNREQVIGIVTKKDAKGRFYKFRVIINGDESEFTQATQEIRAKYSDGDVFYFHVNRLAAGTRGRSDLLPVADWLDVYDQLLYGEGERAKLLRSLVWDLELKNADQNAVTKRSKEFALPGSGGVYVHNDSEKLDPKTPKMEAADTSEGARMLRNHVLGGQGIPEHWFGGGGDVNRAAAAEMDEPTYKLLAMRQSVWKHILEVVGRFVLLKKAEADGDTPDWSKPEWNVQAIFPELVSADLTKYAQALQQLVVGCALAIDKGLMQDKTAVQLIAAVASRFGVEIDAEKELEQAKEELAARKEDDAFTGAPSTGTDDPLPGEAGKIDAAAEGKAAAGAAMKEALDLVRNWKADMDASMARLAEAARDRGAVPDAFAAAMREAAASSAKNVDRLVEALGEHVTRHELELTLKHGETTKSVAVGGKTYTLTEKGA